MSTNLWKKGCQQRISYNLRCSQRDLSGGSVVKTSQFQGRDSGSLELRSHMPKAVAKIKTKKEKMKCLHRRAKEEPVSSS